MNQSIADKLQVIAAAVEAGNTSAVITLSIEQAQTVAAMRETIKGLLDRMRAMGDASLTDSGKKWVQKQMDDAEALLEKIEAKP